MCCTFTNLSQPPLCFRKKFINVNYLSRSSTRRLKLSLTAILTYSCLHCCIQVESTNENVPYMSTSSHTCRQVWLFWSLVLVFWFGLVFCSNHLLPGVFLIIFSPQSMLLERTTHVWICFSPLSQSICSSPSYRQRETKTRPCRWSWWVIQRDRHVQTPQLKTRLGLTWPWTYITVK